MVTNAVPLCNAGTLSTAILVMSGLAATSTTVKMATAMTNATPSIDMSSSTVAATSSPSALAARWTAAELRCRITVVRLQRGPARGRLSVIRASIDAMYAVATFLIVAVITMVFTKLANGALIATGVPPDIAAFQARSAFSGAGFTTTEAENVVNHPTRRKIIAATMFVGNLGTPTLVVTVLAGLAVPGPGSTTERTLVMLAGLIGIVLTLGNRPMQRVLVGVGQRYTRRRLIPALSDQAEELLALGAEFTVAAVRVATDPGDTYRSLRGLEDAIPGARVLGVRRGDGYFGEAPVDLTLRQGDELIVYARRDHLEGLDGSEVAV